MSKPKISEPTVHKMPTDLRKSLVASKVAFTAWNGITPLARNEWVCWVESAKLIETRQRRIKRACTDLTNGKHRPCCWAGCMHRGKNKR